jgi:hypothetical protein
MISRAAILIYVFRDMVKVVPDDPSPSVAPQAGESLAHANKYAISPPLVSVKIHLLDCTMDDAGNCTNRC